MSDESQAAPAVADRMAAARAARAAKKAEAAPAVADPVHHVSRSEAPQVEALEKPIELPAGPTSGEKAAANEDAKRLAKIAALRAAKQSSADPLAEPKVTVRITKKGHGKVSMGEHVSGLGDLTYDHGEMPDLPRSMALELEERGFVEIQ
jgi:hypothetical protein